MSGDWKEKAAQGSFIMYTLRYRLTIHTAARPISNGARACLSASGTALGFTGS